MPTLDRLQGALGGEDFEVVALSIDCGGGQVVRDFFGAAGVERLGLYIDETSRAAITLGA